MITVRTPEDKLFNYTECAELYDECKDKLRDDDFENVVKKSLFYAFYITSTNELIGCIYYYKRNGKTFVNAFANRNHHDINLECFKESLKWFDEDIYAEATEKTSRLCVLRCGFKRIKDNLFIYRSKDI